MAKSYKVTVIVNDSPRTYTIEGKDALISTHDNVLPRTRQVAGKLKQLAGEEFGIKKVWSSCKDIGDSISDANNLQGESVSSLMQYFEGLHEDLQVALKSMVVVGDAYEQVVPQVEERYREAFS